MLLIDDQKEFIRGSFLTMWKKDWQDYFKIVRETKKIQPQAKLVKQQQIKGDLRMYSNGKAYKAIFKRIVQWC